MNIKGRLVTLRAIEMSDLPLLHKWSNDAELWSMLGGWHFAYSTLNTEQWIKNINNNDMKNQVYAIATEENKLIGTANLVNIDWKNKNAFHGMMLGDENLRGKGYAQDTVMAIMRYAFEELGLNRLDSDIIEYNKRSLNFYTKKCGWEIEGIKKNWFYRKNQFIDKVIVGITAQQYENFSKSIKYWSDDK